MSAATGARACVRREGSEGSGEQTWMEHTGTEGFGALALSAGARVGKGFRCRIPGLCTLGGPPQLPQGNLKVAG